MWQDEARADDPGAKDLLQKEELHFGTHLRWARGKGFGEEAVALGAAKDHRLYNWIPDRMERRYGQALDLRCPCGKEFPTRRHWIWECTQFKCSGVVRAPRCQLEEALGVPFVKSPGEPAPANTACCPALVEALKSEVEHRRDRDQRLGSCLGKILAATDGGSRDRVAGGWALQWRQPVEK